MDCAESRSPFFFLRLQGHIFFPADLRIMNANDCGEILGCPDTSNSTFSSCRPIRLLPSTKTFLGRYSFGGNRMAWITLMQLPHGCHVCLQGYGCIRSQAWFYYDFLNLIEHRVVLSILHFTTWIIQGLPLRILPHMRLFCSLFLTLCICSSVWSA